MVEKTELNKESYSEGEGNREKWDRKLEYMLSMLGYTVGLGNLWRFPYLCMKNGGGAFLIPFLIVLLTCGMPLYFMEVAVGQFTGKGTLHVWEVCPLFKGVGIGMIISIIVTCWYYTVIIAWTLHYLASSFIAPLPWTQHDVNHMIEGNITGIQDGFGKSNDSQGQISNKAPYINTSNILPSFVNSTISSEEIYWQNSVLHMSDGIHTIGSLPWEMTVCFLAAWVILYLCVMKGVRSVGKVVYVTATMPYILLLVLLIRGLTLPGSANGIIYYLRPDFSKLLDVRVWIEAALQVFYSLGPGWGTLITMSSYNRFHNNCYRDSIILTFIGEGTSLYAGLAVFSILGFMAHTSNVPIEKVVKSGPGLGFIAYPEVIAQLPLSNVWAVLFFFMLLTVGLDTVFACIEVVITACIDSFQNLRERRAAFTAVLCGTFFLSGLIFCTQGGIYVFQLVDWYIGALAVPLFGLIECTVFSWFYGAEMFSRDVELMLGRKVPVFMRIMWCFVTPLILISILVFTLAHYIPPTYGRYEYPRSAEVVGWIIAIFPFIPVPMRAIVELKKASGNTLFEKLQMTLKPTRHWMPVATDEGTVYRNERRAYDGGMRERIKLNVLGRK